MKINKMNISKRVTLILIAFLFVSCESEENKNSRLTVDKYARKLNSVVNNIVDSRQEEGNQSKLTMSNFYQRYTSRIEDFSNDLNFEDITPKYVGYREDMLSIATNLNLYLNVRREAILSMVNTSSNYRDAIESEAEYNEYLEKMKSSRYSSDYYREMAVNRLTDSYESALEFISYKASYQGSLYYMDSICAVIDSISIRYNSTIFENKLLDTIVIPPAFTDTINDWLLSNKQMILSLELPD